ncbi:MAG: hypothetical protein IT443_05820 [Phycisphaeraceae bacterium]|nr:hypothetical protein [Phycisphaeraceae bacterium]
MNTFKRMILALVLGVGTAGAAQAGTVTAHLDGLVGKSFNYKIAGANLSVTAGMFTWTRTGGTQQGSPSGVFHTFCIEMDQYISLGKTYTYDLIDPSQGPKPGILLGAGPMGMTKAQAIAKIWAAHYDEALTSADNAAAFQVAVWEIVYDADTNLFAGGFQARYASLNSSPLFVKLAHQWLCGLPNLTEMANLGALSNNKNQDQLVVIPVPMAVWTGLALLSGIALRRKMRLTA